MTKDQVSYIEQTLNISLPDFYKDFIINYPNELKGVRTSYTQDIVEDYFLYNEAERIIDSNVEVAGRLGYLRHFPKDKFIIGEDGNGNYYLISLNPEDFSIYFWDHEDTFWDEEIQQVNWNKTIRSSFKSLQYYKQWLIEYLDIKT